MKIVTRLISVAALVLLSTFTALLPAAAPLDIPATDDGLPGAGPIRRYDWFQKTWSEKRTAWAKRVEKDQGALVFLGDSITQSWGDGMGGNFPGVKVANRGISGDTTRGVLIRLKEDVQALNPSGVVLLIGTNDLEENAEPEVIAGNLKLILAELKKHNAKLPIVLCQVFPSSASMKRPADKIKKVNQLYAAAVKGDAQVTFIETYPLLAGPYTNLTKYKPQDWNEMIVAVTNNVGHCTCNGELLTATLKVPATGPIGLEGDRGQMEYRRIRLRELP
jgi:lysophospholipase L1-like esterase